MTRAALWAEFAMADMLTRGHVEIVTEQRQSVLREGRMLSVDVLVWHDYDVRDMYKSIINEMLGRYEMFGR